ncbi:MAG: drug/metabolite transporter (DMT)-like permease [Halobacteriales archaeon]|jgi:drug/metabolite transporter (DMT)-like permease
MDPPGWAEDHVSPMAALGVAVVAVSTSAILVRWSQAPSTVKALYRVVFMTALVAPVAVRNHRDDFARIDRRDLVVAGLAGVALAAHFASWFASLDYTSVAASVTLVQSQPLFVAVGAYLLLGERVTRLTVVGIAIAVVGAAVMSFGQPTGTEQASLNPPLGNALALFGAVMAAAYVLSGRSLRQRIALFPYVTVVYAACSVVLLGIVLVQGWALFAYPPREWILFLGMAIGPGIVGHTVVNWALEHLESSLVSVSLLGEPVGSTVLAFFLLSEVPDPITLVGGAVVLAGIYATARARSGVGA